ncbi:MAG: Crossover junction endonuclease mus81 [Trizodia sp. TS-e1964]|nr:MAG: Crossover junction endonuclease mus81 [Trizodia sp. TS-e1964]
MPSRCANPLFLEWIGEWLEQARERGSPIVQTYKKAYDSIKACPLKLHHPLEAQQLNGLGPKLCQRLTDKLTNYCLDKGLPMPEPPHKGQKRPAIETEAPAPTKKPRKVKPYVPVLRSGPYAILIALASVGKDASKSLDKAQVIEIAQPYCDSSFIAPSDPTKFYSAWASMRTLIDKDLVYEKGRPARKYSLTDEGWDVVQNIKRVTDGPSIPNNGNSPSKTLAPDSPHAQPQRQLQTDFMLLSSPPRDLDPLRQTQPALQFSHEPTARNPSNKGLGNSHNLLRNTPNFQFTPIDVPWSSFTVHLVLDNREARTLKDRDYIRNELARRGVTPIVRSLKLGDALWVAKCNDKRALERYGEEDDEIVLDWIVERKRLDDLIGSFSDRRFREQKKSGIKNVVYIIEQISISMEQRIKKQESINSAIASIQVVDGFFVKQTANLDDTIRYLARMTEFLKSNYEKTPLHLIPTSTLANQPYLSLLNHMSKTQPSKAYHITYTAFASVTSKSENLTLQDIFVKMLLCIKGISSEKALEIWRIWDTPRAFIQAYKSCANDTQKKNMLFERMGSLVGSKKIGKATSARVAEIWGDAKPNEVIEPFHINLQE